MNENNNYKNSEFKEFNSDIDLLAIFKTISRGKIFILSICSISTLISVIHTNKIIPVWQGEVNIVMREKENSNNLSELSNFKRFINNKNSSKKTEELILKSPSVLMPVFNYVKTYYEENGVKKNNFTFTKWSNKEFETSFEDDSNVLKIFYKNSDKDLILKALQLITAKYQNYSKVTKEKNLNNIINSLELQLDEMLKKSNSSMAEFNKFSIKNGLGDIDGFVDLSNLSENNVGQGNNQTGSLNSNIPKSGQRFADQFNLLKQYETSYLDLNSKLKPNSKYLIRLKSRIENLKSSLQRPNEILVKYRELYRLAARDEKLLSNIENSLQAIKLEKFKIIEPWKIISEPTIGEKPIYPNKKSIVLKALLTSLFISTLILLSKEKLDGKIFEKRILENLIKVKFIETFYFKNQNLTKELISKLLEIESKNNKSVDIINFSSLEFINFKNILTSKNFTINKELNLNGEFEINNSSIIFIEPGFITNKNILLINKMNKLYENKIIGWFLLDKDTKLN
tara:strand:+ start:378 stop:1913 length:1536 start_codon:yes stop_codon:yes gene_type:complete